MESGMERKFRYGIWKMPEWNGRFQEWNGTQFSILPYQFHTRFGALYLQKNAYRCHVVIIILLQKYSTSILTHSICWQIAELWMCILCKQCTYSIIVSKLQFNCSIDVTVDDLDRFDLFFCFFYFEADNLPSRKFCCLTLSQKLELAISSPFQLNFMEVSRLPVRFRTPNRCCAGSLLYCFFLIASI